MRNRIALLAVVPLMLGLSACGGNDGDGGVATADYGKVAKPTPSASSTVDPERAMAAYAQCMRRHGVDMKDPQPGQPLTLDSTMGSQATMDKAQQACRALMPQGGQGKAPDMQAERDRALKFAQCMRDHGVNMPDPTFEGDGGILIRRQAGGSPAKEEAAQKACQSYLPGNGISSGGKQLPPVVQDAR